jgi:hypothetical protein
MFEVFIYAVIALVAFGAGLLVGRRNPSVAATIATLANTAKADIAAATIAHKAETGVPVAVSVGATGPVG